MAGLSQREKSIIQSSSDSEDDVYEKCKTVVIDYKEITKNISTSKTENQVNKNVHAIGNNISKNKYRKEMEKAEFDPFSYEQTPEFKAHVATKLAEIIDGNLEFDRIWNHCSSVDASNNDKSNEDNRIFTSSVTRSPVKHTKVEVSMAFTLSSAEDSGTDSEEERLAEAVVTSDAILAASAICSSQFYQHATDSKNFNVSGDNTVQNISDNTRCQNEDTSKIRTSKKRTAKIKNQPINKTFNGIHSEKLNCPEETLENTTSFKTKKRKKKRKEKN